MHSNDASIWFLILACKINRHPLSSAPILFSAFLSHTQLPPLFHDIIFFRGPVAVASPDGAPLRIDLNSHSSKEAGWLQHPSITSIYLIFPSPPPQRNTGSPAFIWLLPDGECFVSPAILSSVLLRAQALPWKITFWGETLIILPALMHPAPVSSD